MTPFSIDFDWHTLELCPELPSTVVPELFDDGSLTALLKSRTEHFRVDVLREKWLASEEQHKDILGPQCRQILCREVLLMCDDIARVYAQSWISTQASDMGVRQLGNRPLGEVLFQDPIWQRSELEVAKVEADAQFSALLNDLDLPAGPMYARRRLFSNESAKIMVCEIFLPRREYATQCAS